MRSVMQHSFSQVPQANIQRSTFSRSHGYKTTFNAGLLIPFLVDEVLPGDTFSVNSTLFARLATPIAPFMDNLFLETFYFYVPHRLVWNHFVNFMGEEEVPGDYVNSVVSYLTPQITTPAGGYTELSLGDYFGIPTKINGLANVNAFAFRAYAEIWNEWFRDENLQAKVAFSMGDGPEAASVYPLKERGKRHDYFTSALPWPQKGPGVSVPLGTSAPVNLGNMTVIPKSGPVPPTFTAPGGAARNFTQTNGGTLTNWNSNATATGAASFVESGLAIGGTAIADLSTATAATINSLRLAFQMQRLYERDARGGSRYTELVRSHFGVVSPDARLQRPEYLGGGSSRINVNPIAQTSATNAQPTPAGTLAAMGTGAQRSGFTKSFTEHGTILGLVNVRADISYQQGLNRSWTRRTRFDFYWPVLANLGEQAILNQEIYAQGVPGTGAAQDQGPFGYQERWAEYRYYPSQITGLFRSNATATLHFCHLAQNFTALPTLGANFILDAPPVNRVIAVSSQPHFLLDTYIDMRATRPMPTYSVPGMIDHF